MIALLFQHQYALFVMILFALVLSLTFHEFGHAFVAKMFGDDTAQQAGRLTLNPAAHIDPFGLLMVVLVGFGYARPVPTNPHNYSSHYGDLWVSAAGPLMNLLLAIVTWNFYLLMLRLQIPFFESREVLFFFLLIAKVNLLLMVFNLLPVAPLDGHYILPYAVPGSMRDKVIMFNMQYGPRILLGLIVLSILGVPIFSWVLGLGDAMLPWITWIRSGATP